MKYPLARPHFDDTELEEIKQVLASGWVSMGPKVTELEKLICSLLGVKYAIANVNCTASLHIALLSMGIRSGDEVLVADYTYPATGHAVLYCGATPRFVDVDRETYNIQIKAIESKITPRTRAIIPVHTFGQPADMQRVMAVARKYNLGVIEDAACALGAKVDDRLAGTIGDVGCFSFHARKGFTSGEGGVLVTNDDVIAEKARRIRNLDAPAFEVLGFNYKMSDILAAIAVVQLRKWDTILSKRRRLGKVWTEAITGSRFLVAPISVGDHIYQSYVCRVNGINRDHLIMALGQAGIQAQIGTYASHVQPIYHSKDYCPISLELFKQAIALPMYYELEDEGIFEMAEIIDKIAGELQ